jgi:UDP-GlcNAc:undecaprenyl-phosphate GlcNAc-1-phosphate transferase
MEVFLAKACILFILALVFSVLVNRIFLRFSRNLGIRNVDDNVIRWASTSKPSFGGISFFIVFLLVLTVGQFVFPDLSNDFDSRLIGILLASAAAFLVGLADDAYNTNPTLKFIAQIICAFILIVSGTHIELFEWEWANYALTLFWVVGMMNSINMLDNMDAVATVASISAIACLLISMVFSYSLNSFYFLVLLGLVGALLGFLFFNWSPSRMYMGDTGSQFLGILLAALAIPFLWNLPLEGIPNYTKIVLVGLAFIVPLIDTTTVTINRIAKGNSPFVGGKDHTTHHLSYLGLSEQSVALLIAGLGILSVALCFILLAANHWVETFTILFGGYAILLFISLFLVSRIPKAEKKQENYEDEIRKSA